MQLPFKGRSQALERFQVRLGKVLEQKEQRGKLEGEEGMVTVTTDTAMYKN